MRVLSPCPLQRVWKATVQGHVLLQSMYIYLSHSKPCPTTYLPPGVCGEVAQGESQLPKTAQLASGGTAELSEDREVVACPHPNFLPFQPRLPPPFFLPKGLQQYGDFSDSLEEPVLGQRDGWGSPISSRD